MGKILIGLDSHVQQAGGDSKEREKVSWVGKRERKMKRKESTAKIKSIAQAPVTDPSLSEASSTISPQKFNNLSEDLNLRIIWGFSKTS